MLFLVVSTPRPERPSELAQDAAIVLAVDRQVPGERCLPTRLCARGAGSGAVLDVGDNDALHQILNEWADIIPAHFDTYPLVDVDATKRMLAAQVAAKKK